MRYDITCTVAYWDTSTASQWGCVAVASALCASMRMHAVIARLMLSDQAVVSLKPHAYTEWMGCRE